MHCVVGVLEGGEYLREGEARARSRFTHKREEDGGSAALHKRKEDGQSAAAFGARATGGARDGERFAALQ